MAKPALRARNRPMGEENGRACEKRWRGNSVIFARTDTKYWQQYVFPVASGILWLEGRVKFYDPTGRPGKYPAPAPSALIAYTPSDLEILAEACETGKIKGNLTIHNITCTFAIPESPLKPILR